MKVFVVIAAVLCCFAFAGGALAQDGDPAESPLENICYAGGEWEYKCAWPTEDETEWAWNCGWYYAAYLRGAITIPQAPEWCKFMFEDTPDEEEQTFMLCIDYGDGYYLLLIGGPNVPGNARQYAPSFTRDGEPCTSLTPEPYPTMWIQLDTEPADPLDLYAACTGFDPSHTWTLVDAITGATLPGFNYLCTAL